MFRNVGIIYPCPRGCSEKQTNSVNHSIVIFAQRQYRSLWGLTEARLLLVENFTQYPAKDDLQYSRRWQFLTVSKETDNMFKINYPSICTAICAWWLSVLFLISYYLSVCPTWPLYYRHCLRKVSVITPRFY